MRKYAMLTEILACVPLVLTAIVVISFVEFEMPKPYRYRPCQGKAWRRAFPTASKEEMREFLTIFGDAFAFSGGKRLKFHPDDPILSIYRAIYPENGFNGFFDTDMLELETLEEEMETCYGPSFLRRWNENEMLTLGELFAATRLTS
jgi:hypothetical protein